MFIENFNKIATSLTLTFQQLVHLLKMSCKRSMKMIIKKIKIFSKVRMGIVVIVVIVVVLI